MKKEITVTNVALEPMQRIDWNRAATLLTSGIAQNIESSGIVRTVRSEKLTLDICRIISINKYFYRDTYFDVNSVASRAGIFARDNNKCVYCGAKATTLDHLHPKSKGGKDTYGNLVAACIDCNQDKADKLLKETNFVLNQNTFEYDMFNEERMIINQICQGLL